MYNRKYDLNKLKLIMDRNEMMRKQTKNATNAVSGRHTKTHLAFDERLQRQVISTQIGHQSETPRRNFSLLAVTSGNTIIRAVQIHGNFGT